MGQQRKVIHLDMDAFYAAVEQRDHPELRDKPVIVGGSPRSRSVVCTASYEARKFGVHSAMPTSQAHRLCPEGIFVRPDFKKYTAASRIIRRVFHEATDVVEPLSLDEAYLDVTENHWDEPSATRIAQRIRALIKERTRLTASAGVAPNKFLAKIASDYKKPDGLTVVPPHTISQFLKGLPVRKIPGVGPRTEERLRQSGITTCDDILRYSEEELCSRFGRSGAWFFRVARGQDDRPVITNSRRKSLSIEDTLPHDEVGLEAAAAHIDRLGEGLRTRLEKAQVSGRTIVLKVKYSDFRQVTRSRTLDGPTDSANEVVTVAKELLKETAVAVTPFRLLGIGLSSLEQGVEQQLLLPFPPGEL